MSHNPSIILMIPSERSYTHLQRILATEIGRLHMPNFLTSKFGIKYTMQMMSNLNYSIG
jgi:hypothetical protein